MASQTPSRKVALPDKPHRCHTDAGIGAARRRLRNMGLPAHIAREQRSDSLPQLQARSLAHYPTSATVAVGMAVTGHPPHRPVLAALPHTVLTLDVPPLSGWRQIADRESHALPEGWGASVRRPPPVSPRWAAVGCAVPAHETSDGRPVSGKASAPECSREPRGIGVTVEYASQPFPRLDDRLVHPPA